MLDLCLLRSFVAILDTGSFTRASERVSKSQSSVSAHIRQLEELLGCVLFEKHGRGVRVSEDGERLAEYARRILALESAAMNVVGKGGIRGRVRFGIPDDYAEPLLPSILEQLMRSNPALEIMIVCEASSSLAERVAAADLDLALVTDSGAYRAVEIVQREPLLWVASASYSVDDARPIPLALGGASCEWRRAAVQTLSDAGIDHRVVLISAHFSAIGPMVASGAAITVLPPSAMRPGMRSLTGASPLPELPTTAFGLLYSPGVKTEAATLLARAVHTVVRTKPP